MKTEFQNTDNESLKIGAACFPVNTIVGCSSKGIKKHLDLFSGIGGFALAAEWVGGFETIAFCEIEKYPKKLLAQNFPGVPIFEDVRKLHAEDLLCKPDVITGGYPCQPFSVAGKQRGEADDRHLWPEMLRIIQECSPKSVICENVAGHIKMGLDTVLTDLENEGYNCWTFIIPACSKGFPHKRDRVWIVANSTSEGLQGWRQNGQQKGSKEKETRVEPEFERSGLTGITTNPEYYGLDATTQQRGNGKAIRNSEEGSDQTGEFEEIYSPENVSNSHSAGLQETGTEQQTTRIEQRRKSCGRTTFGGFTKSPVCRRDDGISNRVDRIKGLGNAIVPQIAYELLKCI